MVLALRSPNMVKDIVSVDNAPVDAILSSEFPRYVRGMKDIEKANVTSQKEADKIMTEVEEVCPTYLSYSSPYKGGGDKKTKINKTSLSLLFFNHSNTC